MKNLLRTISWLSSCLLIAGVVCGCKTTPEEKIVVELNNTAANDLAQQLHRSAVATIGDQCPIIVTTIADVDRLEASSSLGRITAEQIASRLAQLGFNVTEVKVRGNLFVLKEHGEFVNTGSPFSGEFVLSRNIEQIAKSHNANVVIAGTYAVGRTHTIFSIRAIDLTTKRIIAGHDYAVPAVPWQWINPMPEEKRFFESKRGI